MRRSAGGRELGGRVRRAPAVAIRRPELQEDLLRAALGEIAAQGGGHVHMWVPKPGPVNDAVAGAVGFRRGRDLIQMRRELPISEESAVIAVRTFPTR